MEKNEDLEMLARAVETRHTVQEALAKEYNLPVSSVEKMFGIIIERVKTTHKVGSCIEAAGFIGVPGFVYTYHQQTRYAAEQITKHMH